MIEWLIIGGVAFLLLKSNGGTFNPGATAAPVNQATGASLTTTLGSAAQPPSYYATGNPGYTAPAASAPNVHPVIVRPVQAPPRAVITGRIPASVPGTSAPVTPSRGTSAAPPIAVSPTRGVSSVPKPILSSLVNVRQINRNLTAPELSQTFWTRTKYGVQA